MSPVLPETATLKSVITALNALDARVAALEKLQAENREALRAVLTVMHPDPRHSAEDPGVLKPDAESETPLVMARSVHTLMMNWIERLGGRIPL